MLAAVQAWRTKTFRALRHANYRRYWFSQLLSLVGSWMQSTAQSYLVLELTNNNSAALGWVTAAQFTPSLLLSLFAGAVVDRVPRRRVLLATQLTLLATALMLAVTTHLGRVTLPLVLVLAAVSGVANAFDMPARQSMVVDFVPREDVPNAVALNSLSFNVSRTLGQAVFGGVAALGAALFAGRGPSGGRRSRHFGGGPGLSLYPQRLLIRAGHLRAGDPAVSRARGGRAAGGRGRHQGGPALRARHARHRRHDGAGGAAEPHGHQFQRDHSLLRPRRLPPQGRRSSGP